MNITQTRICLFENHTSRVALAAETLIDEVKKRTGIVWHIQKEEIYKEDIQIFFCLQSTPLFQELKIKFPSKVSTLPSEGAQVFLQDRKIYLIGSDERGLFYAVGRFLRNINFEISELSIAEDYHFCQSPAKKIRGHQLAYRPICNTFDNWTIAQFEQYIRELILFGANSIELLPGNTELDDLREMQQRKGFTKIPEHTHLATSWPHMQYEYNEALHLLSKAIDKYGMVVMVWYPNLGKFDTPADIEDQLKERELVFQSLHKLDRLVIPSGDPGELHPDQLFSFADKVSQLLQKYHPKAHIRMTLQAFHQSDEWVARFFYHVNKLPSWLKGLTISPWLKIAPEKLRKIIDPKLEIHHYPDITHNLNCQYPVQNWDLAFAIGLGREAINPRPKAQKRIHNLVAPYVEGSIGYSEGIHDDLNKFIWLDQDWNPEATTEETVRDYANFFMSSRLASQLTKGLYALEENWNNPVLNNPTVSNTYLLWQEIKESASLTLESNYRFQMHFLRSLADYYIQSKHILESECVNKIELLIKENRFSNNVVAEISLLTQIKPNKTLETLNKLCQKIGDALYLGIGYQLSVKKHLNVAWNRGAFLDTIDLSSTNIEFYKNKISNILETKEESNKEKIYNQIREPLTLNNLITYENYKAKHHQFSTQMPLGSENDPAFYHTPFINFAVHLLHLADADSQKIGAVNRNWLSQISSRYDEPLKLTFKNISPSKKYELQATCTKQYFGNSHITITSSNGVFVQPEVLIDKWVDTIICPIPVSSIENNCLQLSFTTPNGELGPNIAEIKLLELS